MPFGGNDWLALTPEEALEPEIPICDPHHHFWDFRTERIPFQRYLLHELADDVNGGHNVRSTVFVEARSMYRPGGPEEMRPVGEVEFVQGLAAASDNGLYGPCKAAASIVGHANLNLGENVRPVLEALQAASPNRFRGIRHSVTWDASPEVENTAAHKAEGQMSSDNFRAGAKVLADMGLTLEGWMFFPQMTELAEFAKAVPESDHHPEPHRRADKGRPLCRARRRGVRPVAQGHRRRRVRSQRGHQAGRHRYAPDGVRLARSQHAHRLRGAGVGHEAAD